MSDTPTPLTDEEERLCKVISHSFGPMVTSEFAREREIECNAIKSSLQDPAAVWANMLRGTIARPRALDHYEECKLKVETLERELNEAKENRNRACNCDLNLPDIKVAGECPHCRACPVTIYKQPSHSYLCRPCVEDLKTLKSLP